LPEPTQRPDGHLAHGLVRVVRSFAEHGQKGVELRDRTLFGQHLDSGLANDRVRVG
jgi:hypothetical protein